MAEAEAKAPTVEPTTESKPEEKPETDKKDKNKKDKGGKGGGKNAAGRTGAPSGPLACRSGYRLNVKHLNENIAGTNEKLKALFEPFGNVTDAQVKTKDDGKTRGFGFVVFAIEEDAKKAVAEMNGKELYGKTLFVGPAERREDDNQAGGKGKGKGKSKQAAALAAAQAAYMQQYMMMHQAFVTQTMGGDQEHPAPGEYQGVLKSATRYGVKKHYLVCNETYQYYGDHVNIDKELLPAGAQDGDTVKFTAVMKFGEWKAEAIAPAAVKGYPKASIAKLVSKA